MEVSIVVPVYNEKDNIILLMNSIIETMDKTAKEYELLFVNDGSTDGSEQILNDVSAGNSKVRLINLDKNNGLTAAIDAGFRSAQGDVVITLDADLQNDPADIPLLLEKIGDYDMVCGWRHKRDDPWLKLVSSKVANSIRNFMSKEDVKDTGCTLKAYRRECLDKIKLYEGLHRFLPTLFKMEGFSVTEVKVNHHSRRSGKSKFNVRNRVFKSFIDLLAIMWMKNRHLNYKVINTPQHQHSKTNTNE